jgi:MFS family permease
MRRRDSDSRAEGGSIMRQMRLLLGISVFWLALSMLFDGVNTLVLPQHLLGFTQSASRATTLGLLSFVGLLLGMLVQPVTGLVSDHLRPRWGRRAVIALGVVLILGLIAGFGPGLSVVLLVQWR